MAIAQLVAIPPAYAQETPQGQVAGSAAGQVGQRLTVERADTRFRPTRRIPSRIQNRVQSRIPTRIDRFYNAEADALTSFEETDERIRRPR